MSADVELAVSASFLLFSLSSQPSSSTSSRVRGGPPKVISGLHPGGPTARRANSRSGGISRIFLIDSGLISALLGCILELEREEIWRLAMARLRTRT